ncbi:hypothetical protein MXMO3_03552 (plasmid) [Maritalea myrionectae]|uniref:DUF1468 domain-containing protein n=1 Tax=Maritalea myrionectae TaxID=454601 RepID=A0A2R4MJA9_9HYPH|nr:tripartite tricarboxylate transporter TctB family protein [Maritalea myrionectae]AVX06055.1 hypothetical protein MXMO3_03552 [Maritalea myrionectae]
MLDRIFASAIAIVAVAYTLLAFTVIKAPFQYDPLGPESWPRILGIAAIFCCALLLIKPDAQKEMVARSTLARLLVLIGLLSGYAYAFEPMGFIPATFFFCAALSSFLGARVIYATVFALLASVGGYALCAVLLDLNLPAGILASFL